jgi:hypothetical protein
MSTGKHLHWELRLGKQHIWDANGKNYIEPIAFFKALIAQEASLATAKVVATDKDPVAPAPTHDEAGTAVVDAELAAKKAEAKAEVVAPVAAKPVVKKPTLPADGLKVGSSGPAVSYLQKFLKIAETGKFDAATKNAVVAFQKKHKDITKPDGTIGPLTWGKIK